MASRELMIGGFILFVVMASLHALVVTRQKRPQAQAERHRVEGVDPAYSPDSRMGDHKLDTRAGGYLRPKCLLAKARPEPDFKYFSKRTALLFRWELH